MRGKQGDLQVEGTVCAQAQRWGQGLGSHHPSSERSDLPAAGATRPEFSPYRTVWLWERPQFPHLRKTERRAPGRLYGKNPVEEQVREECSDEPRGSERQEPSGPHPPHVPTASCTADLTVASSLNTEDTFRKAETTFSGSDVSV